MRRGAGFLGHAAANSGAGSPSEGVPDASVLYNAACTYCALGRKPEAIETLKKAWDAGWRDSTWVRRDPDLATLHGDPDFERLYPAGAGA